MGQTFPFADQFGVLGNVKRRQPAPSAAIQVENSELGDRNPHDLSSDMGSRGSFPSRRIGFHDDQQDGPDSALPDDSEMRLLARLSRPGAGRQPITEVGGKHGQKVSVAFALDCCDRESISFVTTTEGIKGEMLAPHDGVRRYPLRLGQSPARLDRMADRQRLGLHRRRNPALRSRDRLRTADDAGPDPAVQRHGRVLRANHQARLPRVNPMPSAEIVVRQLPAWFDHYNRLTRTRRCDTIRRESLSQAV
jgi:hypothetical protein